MSAPNIEAERAVELENFWHNISHNDTETLETYFVNMNEWGGIPITKDNFEKLFDEWSQTLTIMDLEYILQ